ncbi:MAG: T9SS type A sorting domain-containing protein [Chitinophagaceae bacterium]|nr:T9SS type A sorting domain-containing protein [Chitinophagaceae bacterium]
MLDANVVVFDAAYNSSVDENDAVKLGNPGANFAIETDSKLLAIEGRQPATSNDVVQFRIWNLQQQSYKLEITAIDISTTGLSAVLEDSYLNTAIAIDLVSTTSINFTVDGNTASSAANRFRIVFKQLTALPITFVSINGSRTTGGNKIDWKVAGERNISKYELESSVDAVTFSTVKSVAATGNNGSDISYSLTDATAQSASVFYRIKGTDNAGQAKYSSVVKVAAASATYTGITVYPNPVKDKLLNLKFTEQATGKYQVSIMNASGQVLLSKTIQHNGGSATQRIGLPSSITGGVYQLQVAGPGNTSTVQQLIIDPKD